MSAPRGPGILAGGAAAGGATAAAWGGAGLGWLACGALLGLAGAAAAAEIAKREPTWRARVASGFLTLLATLGLIPLLAVGGLVPALGPATGLTLAGALVPAAAALLFAWSSYGRRSQRAAAPRERADVRHWGWISGALSAVLLLALADARVPAPYSLDFLYLVPVLAVTWSSGRWAGLVLALLAAEARGIARGLSSDGALSVPLVAMDSLLVVLGLATAALLLAGLRDGLQRETSAARTDPLTGLTNRAAFLLRLEIEAERAQRYARPLSLAYLDLDGFKGINDRNGHAAGDEVLRIVAGVLRSALRSHDLPARLGGDEFGVLLPETGAEDAGRVLQRLRAEIEDRMRGFDWPVTCSVGVVTSGAAPATADDLVRSADALMYEVKHSGKNDLRQAVLPGV